MTDLNNHSTQLASATIYKYFARCCQKHIGKTLKRGSALHRIVQTLKNRRAGLGSFDPVMIIKQLDIENV